MKKLLILDANSIINRAFYAVRPLTTKEGFNTNAIFGFLNILFKYTEEIAPDYIAAAFDLPQPTFRHKMYDGYKATRHKMPDELREQMPVMKEILSAMNINIYEKEGYEADDIIGTVSRICEDEDVCCCVLTGDKDDLQLATRKVLIHLVTTRMGNTTTEIFDDKKVFEKYGVTPDEFIDLKAIMGDASDNIPGVHGIGEKGATALISQYHSIDGVYENIDAIKGATKTKLENGREDAYLSKTLATIDKFVPIDFSVSANRVTDVNKEELYNIFTRLEFNSFIKKMGLVQVKSVAQETDFFEGTEFEKVYDKTSLKSLLKNDDVYFLMDFLTDEVAFCTDEKRAYLTDFSKNIELWKEFFESERKKITHGLKEVIVRLSKYGIDIKNAEFDSEIAAYLLEPSRKNYEISELAQAFLGIYIEPESKVEQLSLDSMISQEENTSLMKQVLALKAVKEYETQAMEEQEMTELFNVIEMPLIYVLASMETAGIKVDTKLLESFGENLKKEQNKLTDEIFEIAGHDFNINSTKQLGVVLFDELGLKAIKKTKSGYSTNAEVLEKLRLAHPIVEKILEYRKISKLISTYVDGLLSVIDKSTGRVHSSFNQTVTVTGRISSTEPNLQNIPVRTPLGREMRKMFVAENSDYVLVDADYSQIELRVLAHIADDENMIESFKNGKDIHSSTASKIFGVDEKDVTTDMRSAAKAINFGLVYGMGEFSLSQDLKISVKAAKAYINDYLGSYPKVKQYMTESVDFAKENGYVKTMFGRRRHIPEISSSNYQLRSFGERAAMNTPVQGSAADIIKLAMVNVSKKLKEENLKSRLILQVHDELIIEALKSEEEKVKEILKTEMEKAVSLKAPLKVDMESGNSWYDTK